MEPYRIAVFASGQGSNFQAIVDEVKSGQLDVSIELLVCDRRGAKVIERAEQAAIETLVLSPKDFPSREAYEQVILERLNALNVDLIVLAGYMRLISHVLLEPYGGRIINIHPSLLPAFPGKQGALDALNYGVKVTGCTVHFVDSGVDTGPIIAQEVVAIEDQDTLDSLMERIHQAERTLYPKVIGWLREGRVRIDGRKVFIEKSPFT